MPKTDLDIIDLKILSALQENARIPNIELAREVGLSPSPCLRRVRALEELGVIRHYVTLLDSPRLGLGVSVFIQVSLEKQVRKTLERFEKAVLARPEVMECYLMTGDADYLLRVVLPDVPSYEHFVVDQLTKIPGVSSIKSSFALKEVKHSTSLPLKKN